MRPQTSSNTTEVLGGSRTQPGDVRWSVNMHVDIEKSVNTAADIKKFVGEASEVIYFLKNNNLFSLCMKYIDGILHYG